MDPDEFGGKDFYKSMAEQKLRSFSIGNMVAKRTLTKKEQEELRKKQEQARVWLLSPENTKSYFDIQEQPLLNLYL